MLLAPTCWRRFPPAATAPAGGALTGRLVLAVASDVPQSASQRVVAAPDRARRQVQAVDPVGPATPPAAALLVWYPEVAEPALALEELALARRIAGAVRTALDAADGVRDFDRRRAELQRVEEGLRDAGLVPPGPAPLPSRRTRRRARAARDRRRRRSWSRTRGGTMSSARRRCAARLLLAFVRSRCRRCSCSRCSW